MRLVGYGFAGVDPEAAHAGHPTRGSGRSRPTGSARIAVGHPLASSGVRLMTQLARLPLLEVVRGGHTDDATLATALAVGKALRKSCVLVVDAPAFVVNRLLTRFLGEITSAVEQGTPVAVADHALDPLGLPMTPFELLSLVGPPVARHVAERMHKAFPDRFTVAAGLRRMVELGRSSMYTEPGVVDPDLAGIVAGWPFWLGGITPYLDRSGVAEAVTGSRFLPRGVADLPAPDPIS